MLERLGQKFLFKESGRISALVEWVIACILFEDVLGNVLFFYITGGAELGTLRFLVNWIINGMLFLIIGACFVMSPRPKVQKAVVLVWMIFVVTVYAAAVVVHTSRVSQIVKDAAVFVLMGGTLTMVAGLLYWHVATIESIIKKAVWIGALVQPFFIIADVTFWFRTTTKVNNLGTIGYLEMSYAALTVVAVACYHYGWGQTKTGRYTKITNVVAILEAIVSGATIIILGSRGALLALAVLTVGVLVIGLCFKARHALFGLVTLIALSAIISYVGMPESAVTKFRYESMIESIPGYQTGEQQIEIAEEDSYLSKPLEGPTKWLCEKLGINQQLLSIFHENAWNDGGMNAIALAMRSKIQKGDGYGEELDNAVLSITNGSSGRWYFWTLAVYELQESHGWGVAPYTYHLKYNSYAHNIWIEAYTEFGLLGGTVFLILTFWVLVRAVQEARKDKSNSYVLLFLAMAFTKLFVSGNIYGDRWLSFLIAMGAISTYSIYKEKNALCR